MLRTLILSISLCLLLPSCRLMLTANEGGDIVSASGDNDCAEASTCIVDVENGAPFSDTFSARPREGYIFAGWDKGLCQNKIESCTLSATGELTDRDVDLGLKARFVAPAPMHYFFSSLGLGVLPGGDLAALLYGFNRSDLDDLNPASAFYSNQCFVSSSLLSQPEPTLPGINIGGTCVESGTLGIADEGPFALVYPPLSANGVTVSERVVPIDLAALESDGVGFSTSMAETATINSNNGFLTSSFLQSFVAKKSTGLEIADMVGDWVLTRLELAIIPTVEVIYTIASFTTTISDAGGGTLSLFDDSDNRIETEFVQFLNGAPLERRYFGDFSLGEDVEIPLALNSDGEFTILADPQTIAGFVTPGADLFFLSEGVPNVQDLRNGDDILPLEGDPAYQLFVGVRHNDNPLVQGKKYRMIGTTYQVTNNQVELTRWTDKARMQFTGASRAEWRFNNRGYRINQANAGGVDLEEIATALVLDARYSIDADGRISIDLDGVDGLDGSLVNGYASPDSRVLVFSHGLSFDNGQSGQVGLWIGLCMNCD